MFGLEKLERFPSVLSNYDTTAAAVAVAVAFAFASQTDERQ